MPSHMDGSSKSTSTPNTPRTFPMSAAPSGGSGTATATTTAAGKASDGTPIIHIRKTSHKAAEQKRRDSLKTTFDDLRKLLPPIALPNEAANADIDPTSPLIHPTAPLLPGALPPRGPPKAGGEGPNKGVSKLQLLICGNEYIRVLKARVERRDEEVERLRREVGRLRVLVEEGGSVGGGEEDGDAGEAGGVDLERDLDAVEKVGMLRASSSMNKGGESINGLSSNASAAGGDDMMDEGDDEDE